MTKIYQCFYRMRLRLRLLKILLRRKHFPFFCFCFLLSFAEFSLISPPFSIVHHLIFGLSFIKTALCSWCFAQVCARLNFSPLTVPKYNSGAKWRSQGCSPSLVLSTLMWNTQRPLKNEIAIVFSWGWWFSGGFQTFCHFAGGLSPLALHGNDPGPAAPEEDLASLPAKFLHPGRARY